jgi:hypothetical protein
VFAKLNGVLSAKYLAVVVVVMGIGEFEIVVR